MVWGWVCVCLVTLAVAYSMAEMCSAYEPNLTTSSLLLTFQDTLSLAVSTAGWPSWLQHAGLGP